MHEKFSTSLEDDKVIKNKDQHESTRDEVERIKFNELKQRYLKLYDWAKNQKFVIVYRAEGDPNWNISRSASTQHVGTWYTPSFSSVLKYKSEIENLSEIPAKIYALIIPDSSLKSRDEIDKGMNQVNVPNQELRAGRIEIHDPTEIKEPSMENYLNQFEFIKEYKNLEEKYGTL
jgi:hypothetical protein